MRTLWLNWLPAVEQAIDKPWHKASYPLCFNLPSISWKFEIPQIVIRGGTVRPTLWIDYIIELEKDVTANVKFDESWIRSKRLCIGVADHRFEVHSSKTLIATARDHGVFRYYARWTEGQNIVSPPLFDTDFGSSQCFTVSIKNKTIYIKTHFRHLPFDVLNFFSGFTMLSAGDLISMGYLVEEEPLPDMPTSININSDQSWFFKIELIREN